MDIDINTQADILAQKIRHIIIISSGHRAKDATVEQFYTAACTAFKEELMINWTATLDTHKAKRPRILNFISMEYLPGRLTGNNVKNLCANELVDAVLKKMGRTREEIVSCEPDPGLGNGGLGRLSSCFLDSLATLHYPARAYGLRYQYGIFDQEIWNGAQVERPDCWLMNLDPWELRRDDFATLVHFGGTVVPAANRRGDEVYLLDNPEEVRAVPFDVPIIGYSEKPNHTVLFLRLWSTKESPRNFQLQRYNAGHLAQAAENTTLTDVLYPNDFTEMGKRIRLKQEFLLASASLKDIIRRHLHNYPDLSNFADKVRIQINDTHPALIIAELMHRLTKDHSFSWQDAWEICQTVCSYTNHTILREGLEEWSEQRMHELLPRQFKIIQKLNDQFCKGIREKIPGDEESLRRMSIIENGQVRMAHLAIVGSHKINGVAKLHTEILKHKLFKEFYALDPTKFVNVTNGVTQRRWLLHSNPLLAAFISKRIGSKWITDFSEIKKLAEYASDKASQEEFLAIKQKNKDTLATFLRKENPIRDGDGNILSFSEVPDSTALFDVQIKRFHEYKRQLMNILHVIMIYQDLLEGNQDRIPRLVLFGGKAAPGYEKAKQIMQLICAVARKIASDPRVNKKLAVIFVENYNVSKAELIIPASDLSEQISAAGWEASGTGNMKQSINGALTIGTEDGANIEMRENVTDPRWPFRFGASAEENQLPHRASDVYQSDPAIRLALDSLLEDTFVQTRHESHIFHTLFHTTLENDTYRVLKDLRAYYETQLKVEALYRKPLLWAETAIHNMAAMGPFSTDESIRNYAQKVWDLAPCPPDPEILARVREEYSEHDRCKIK